MKRAELSIKKGNECRLTQRCKNETLHLKLLALTGAAVPEQSTGTEMCKPSIKTLILLFSSLLRLSLHERL